MPHIHTAEPDTDPLSGRELLLSLGIALLWVLFSTIAVQLWLLPVRML